MDFLQTVSFQPGLRKVQLEYKYVQVKESTYILLIKDLCYTYRIALHSNCTKLYVPFFVEPIIIMARFTRRNIFQRIVPKK